LVANSQISWYADVPAPHNQAQGWAAISRIRRRVIDTRFAKTWPRTLPSPTANAICLRAQSTGAIYGRNLRAQFTTAMRTTQPRNGDVPAGAWLARRNLPNRSILLYKLLWCGRVTNGDVSEALRESVRISNIKIGSLPSKRQDFCC